MADSIRVAYYRNAPNAEFVRRHKDGKLVRIVMHSFTEDYERSPRHGNAQRDTYRHEDEFNPPNVWAFKEMRRCGRAARPHDG